MHEWIVKQEPLNKWPCSIEWAYLVHEIHELTWSFPLFQYWININTWNYFYFQKLTFLLVHSAISVYSVTNQFTEEVFPAIIDENLNANDTVLDLDSKSIINTDYEKENSQLFCYNDLFWYDRRANSVRLTRQLDREELCPVGAQKCFVTVKVHIYSLLHTSYMECLCL